MATRLKLNPQRIKPAYKQGSGKLYKKSPAYTSRAF
jgi:hypothetical protein